jgi:hypothetical protein
MRTKIAILTTQAIHPQPEPNKIDLDKQFEFPSLLNYAPGLDAQGINTICVFA